MVSHSQTVKAFDKTIVTALENSVRGRIYFVTLKKIHVVDAQVHGELATISESSGNNSAFEVTQDDDSEYPQYPEDPKSIPFSVFIWNGWIHTSPKNREDTLVFQVQSIICASSISPRESCKQVHGCRPKSLSRH